MIDMIISSIVYIEQICQTEVSCKLLFKVSTATLIWSYHVLISLRPIYNWTLFDKNSKLYPKFRGWYDNDDMITPVPLVAPPAPHKCSNVISLYLASIDWYDYGSTSGWYDYSSPSGGASNVKMSYHWILPYWCDGCKWFDNVDMITQVPLVAPPAPLKC